MFKSIPLDSLSSADVQNYLQHAVTPRPICFASTIDKKGNVNLSPFSFFNLFSSKPPIVIFSPCRRVRDNTTKHTLDNCEEVPEVVINIVTYEMVQQVSLSSCEYEKGINEFKKAGFTEEPSKFVRPPRVKESPVHMECKIRDIIKLGKEGGAGNLIIAEVILMHINENILNEKGYIDQQKLDVVSRLGGNWYARINKSNMFEVEKPNLNKGIGIDSLPEEIKKSKYLTGNDLGQLANVEAIPDIDPAFENEKLKKIFEYFAVMPNELEKELHIQAHELLADGLVREAWQVLLAI